MSIRTAVVLAGGLGTRLRSVVSDLPKPMAPIAGRPFLEYLFDYWIDQGIERFVLSVGYRHEAIVEHFGDGYRGATLHYAREPRPLGTGGGLLMALEHLTEADENFLLLNGDTWFTLDLATLQQYAEQHHADCCLALFRNGNPGVTQASPSMTAVMSWPSPIPAPMRRHGSMAGSTGCAGRAWSTSPIGPGRQRRWKSSCCRSGWTVA